jgi:hypothetical protein
LCGATPFDEHAEVVEVVRTVDPAAEAEDIIYLTDLPKASRDDAGDR